MALSDAARTPKDSEQDRTSEFGYAEVKTELWVVYLALLFVLGARTKKGAHASPTSSKQAAT